MLALRDRFRTADRRYRIEADRRRSRDFIRQRDEQAKKREDIEENASEAATAFSVAFDIATPVPPERIVAFEAELTKNDIAVVEALLENERLQDLITAQLQILLDQAFVLPDGRRVFRTEDGSQVFDEFGEEVPPEVVDPSSIPDDAPSWESFQALKEQSAELAKEREEILEYQSKLDIARDRLDADDLTLEELEDLEADLADAMPPAVSAFRANDAEPSPDQTVPCSDAVPMSDLAPPYTTPGWAGPT